MKPEEPYLLNEEDCKVLLQKIVDTHLPEESLAFALQGDQVIKSMFSKEWRGHQEGLGDRYGFADLATTKTVLDIVLVAFGTLKVISELRLLKRKENKLDVEDLQRQWEKRLRDEGVKASNAKAIAASFSQELVNLT